MTDNIGLAVRVVYSNRFLRSMAEPPSSIRWRDRGMVHKIEDGWLATVWWEVSATLTTINLANLSREDRVNDDAPFECGDAWNGLGFRPLL